MSAGLVSMQALTPSAFDHLEALGDRLRARLSDSIQSRQAPFCVTGAASLFRIHTKRRPPNDFREAYASPGEADVMKAVSRYFATQGIIIPSATSASLSTPMTLAEMDHVADVFDRFLETQSASYESLRS